MVPYSELRTRLILSCSIRFLSLFFVVSFLLALLLWKIDTVYEPAIWLLAIVTSVLVAVLVIVSRMRELERAVAMLESVAYNPYSIQGLNVRKTLALLLCGTGGRRRVLELAEYRYHGQDTVRVRVVDGQQLWGMDWVKAQCTSALK